MIKLTRTNYAGSSTSTLPDIKLIAEPSDINVVDPSETPGIPFVTIRAAQQPGYVGEQTIIMQTPYLGVLVLEYIEDTHDSANPERI